MLYPLDKLRAFDTETYAVDLRLVKTPRVVCASYADERSERLAVGRDVLRTFRGCVVGDGVIVGCNLVFDFGVVCAAFPEAIPDVFKCLEEGRAISIDVLEALRDNSRGCMYVDPVTRQPMARDQSGEAVGRYSLSFLEQRYLGIDRSHEKDDPLSWRMRYAELDGVPPEKWPREAVDYPKRDARGTYDVAVRQLTSDASGSPGECPNLARLPDEMRAAWALHLMSVWGVRTDPEMVTSTVARIRQVHEESRAKFLLAGFVKRRKPRGGKDPEESDGLDESGAPFVYSQDKKAIAEAVTRAYAGAPPVTAPSDRFPSGQVSTSRDTLVESGEPLLEEYGEAGPNEKLLSTYADVLQLGTRSPICPEFNVLVSSGRTSCSRPNLQQLPRKSHVPIRETFWARPGTLWCSVDYNTLELVTLSQVCLWWFKRSAMADAINSGQDLHTRLVARVMGADYDSTLARRNAEDKQVTDLRQAMKEVNFGLPGFMGPPKLVQTARKKDVRFCELAGVREKCGTGGKIYDYYGRPIPPTCEDCLALAIKYRDLWYEEWPEMRDYHEICKQLADDGAAGVPVETFARGKMLRLSDSPGSIANHFFQSLAAVLAKDALWRVSQECYVGSGPLRGSRPLLFIHDEIIAEVPEATAHEAAQAQCALMVETGQEHVPDVKVSAEPALMRRWFKEAKALYTDGRLVPWSPEEVARRKALDKARTADRVAGKEEGQ